MIPERLIYIKIVTCKKEKENYSKGGGVPPLHVWKTLTRKISEETHKAAIVFHSARTIKRITCVWRLFVCFYLASNPSPTCTKEIVSFSIRLAAVEGGIFFFLFPPPRTIIIIIPQEKEKRRLKLYDYLFIPVGGSIALLFNFLSLVENCIIISPWHCETFLGLDFPPIFLFLLFFTTYMHTEGIMYGHVCICTSPGSCWYSTESGEYENVHTFGRSPFCFRINSM